MSGFAGSDRLQSSESGEAGAAEEPAAAGAAADAGGESQGGAAAAEEGEEEAAAEQRVLGDLEGAPGWAEVMDMGSRKVHRVYPRAQCLYPEASDVEWASG